MKYDDIISNFQARLYEITHITPIAGFGVIDEERHRALDAALRVAVEERTGDDPGCLCVFTDNNHTTDDVARAAELMTLYPSSTE